MTSAFPILYSLLIASLAACHSSKDIEQQENAERSMQQVQVETRAQELASKVVANVEEQQRASEIVKAVEDTRIAQTKLVGAPNDFFEWSGLKMDLRGDDGRPQRTVREVSITNKSRFAVTQIGVRADFLQDGVTVASIPLTMRGALPAGATRRYSVDDETLAGASVMTPANETRLVIVSVTLDPAPLAAQ